MSNLLTREEYEAIAGNLTLPANAFIDGSFRASASGRTFATVNPATGEKLADIAICDAIVDFNDPETTTLITCSGTNAQISFWLKPYVDRFQTLWPETRVRRDGFESTPERLLGPSPNRISHINLPGRYQLDVDG